jgi:hypothetical protein
MDRKTLGWIWAGGVVLMILIYLFGPEHFLTVVTQAITDSLRWVSDLIDTMVQRAFEVVRAAAIALYVVFLVLGVLSMSRGVRAGGALFVVSVVFLLLVRTDWYEPGTKWLAALVLTAVAAMVQTQRLLRTPRARGAGDPWGMAMRGGKPNKPPS